MKAFRYDEIYTSDITTIDLLAMALTLPTVPMYSNLHGRSHAFYAIAVTQVKAMAFVLDNRDAKGEPRIMAANALALAGYSRATLKDVLAEDQAKAERGGQ